MTTRLDTYSSFHLSGNETVSAALNTPEVWPKGSIIYKFLGRLDTSGVSSPSTAENENVEDSFFCFINMLGHVSVTRM